MSWSKHLPLITGWYWYRGGYHSKDAQMYPVVIHVEVPRRGLDYAIAWQPGLDYAPIGTQQRVCVLSATID